MGVLVALHQRRERQLREPGPSEQRFGARPHVINSALDGIA
jgi:hypothetical protein